MSSTARTHDEGPSFEDNRLAELSVGRARLEELSKNREDHDEKDFKRRLRDADEQIKEDERRRDELLNAAPMAAGADRDRAGAEVADQAQSELESVIHNADRQERILTAGHSISVELLEHPTVDMGKAEQQSMDLTTAQAVNQPVVLAEQAGEDTSKVLNPDGWPEERIDERLVAIPPEKYTPRSRKKAEELARKKTPDAETVVREGWHEGKGPDPDAAVKAVRKARDPEALG